MKLKYNLLKLHKEREKTHSNFCSNFRAVSKCPNIPGTSNSAGRTLHFADLHLLLRFGGGNRDRSYLARGPEAINLVNISTAYLQEVGWCC